MLYEVITDVDIVQQAEAQIARRDELLEIAMGPCFISRNNFV